CPPPCPQQLVVGDVTRLWLGERVPVTNIRVAVGIAPQDPGEECRQGHGGGLSLELPGLGVPEVTQPVSPALASPAVEDEEDVTELEMPEEFSRCWGGSDKQVPGVPSTPGTATCRYVIIPRCRSFCHAQRICARRFRGRLASIHDSHTNTFLLLLARRCTNAGLVWIGGVPGGGGCWWAGHGLISPLLSPDGLWRSVRCKRRLPFICEI
uniref:Uncharacterized protein n=1 Tax=Geospiza parvula TaxID=87175 RepID=A0A8C3MZJ1_GEOPR